MKYLNKRIFAAVFAAAAFASAAAAQQNDISGIEWRLVQIDGRRVADSNASLQIAPGQNRFTGDTGCNRMFGSLRVNRSRINFTNVGSTRRACTDREAVRTENAFLRALERVTRYDRTGNTLDLYDRGGLVLKFRRAGRGTPDTNEPQKVRLEDKRWVLSAIAGRGVSKTASNAFVVFDPAKGSAGGNTNCNVFGGSYTARADRISITEIISTMRACEEGDRMAVERSLLDGLRNANRYEIENGKLMLYRDRRLLLTFDGHNK